MKRFLPLVALALAGCVTAPAQPALVKPTASGFAEGTFRSSTIAAVQSKLAAHCLSQGHTVDDVNPLQVSCGSDVMGYRAETLHVVTTWTLVQMGNDVHVTASAVTVFPGGGRELIRGNNAATNKMQASLAALGAE
jgi:hypothetical protein